MSFISIAILSIILLLPVILFAMCFIIALGKRHGCRRRHPNDILYKGPERRCRFRKACPVGEWCRTPQECIFNKVRQEYRAKLNLRNHTAKNEVSMN